MKLGGPAIQVDTTGEVDISQLVEKLNQVRRGDVDIGITRSCRR
jgi:hypothetical protein